MQELIKELQDLHEIALKEETKWSKQKFNEKEVNLISQFDHSPGEVQEAFLAHLNQNVRNFPSVAPHLIERLECR